jgi:hypothetical protein
MNKISICTVSMNRLSHIQETLPVNISENINYPNIEFVLLDYNSSDGLEDWVRSNMMSYIESGLLKYYRTTEPAYFSMSHSKNMASCLSTGDILCMMDGDNFAGLNYAHWINEIFCEKGNNAFISAFDKHGLPIVDMGGKISFHRELFASACGFDEAFIGYGMDDKDLIDRLEKAGGIPVTISDKAFMRYIQHSSLDRIKNYHLINNLQDIYMDPTGFLSGKPTKVLYLLNDNSLCDITYKYKKEFEKDFETIGGWYAERSGYKTGSYERTADGYLFNTGTTVSYKKESDKVISSFLDGQKFVLRKMIKGWYILLVKSYSEALNRMKYIENREQIGAVNPDGWGKGTVYLNFDYKNPIITGYSPKNN